MSSSSKKILYLGIFFVVILIIAIPKLTFLHSESKNPDKPGSRLKERGGGISVRVNIINKGALLDKINSSGTILANEEVELRSEISGKVIKIYFKEGSFVKKGDVLLKINDSELQAQLLKANFRKKLAEEKENRSRAMLDKDAISKEEYDAVLNELNTINADIQLINAQIDKTEIKAPFNGRIGLKSISEGSYLSPSIRIADLQDISRVKIDFSIPEKYSGTIKVGNQIKFSLHESTIQYSGTIYAVEPKIDPETRTLKVRAISSNNNTEIYPGSFAEIEVALMEYNNAIMIPTEAVIPDVQGQKVFLYRKGKAISIPVEIGVRKERMVQITKGIQFGDTLITSGIMQLKPGIPVKISEIL